MKHVIISIPVLLVGGTEVQTLNLLSALVGAGYKVTVCCYYEYDPDMVSRFEAAGSKVLLMRLKRAKGLGRLAKELYKLFKKLKPDIVHVQYLAPGLIPIISARIAGIKTIFATVHQPGRVYGSKAKLFVWIAAKLCTVFFCVSRSVEESWFGSSELFDPEKAVAGRKHFTMYDAVDSVKIAGTVRNIDCAELRRTLGIEGRKVAGIVARLRHEKGHAVLLDAMVEVINKIPDAVLLVVGDGPGREELRAQAERLGISDHVVWLGQRSPDEVFQLYGIMDLAVVPSLFEGFGLSAAEAMAAGLPVVGTRVDGLSEIIEDGVTGYFVSVGDTQGFAQSLINLLSNPEKARVLGRKGREMVKERFSMERFGNSVLSLYEEFGK